MDLFKQLNTENIDFVLIDKLVKSETGSFEDMLEFTVWEKPVGLSVVGFKLRHTLSEAFDIFNKLSKYNVNSNYVITDLYDEQVLAGISCGESIVSKLLGTSSFNRIELKVSNDSIYNVLYKSVMSGGMLKTEYSEGFGTVRGIHFNESTLDIVWRYRDPQSGFKTYAIMQDDIVNDFSVRCNGPLNIPCGSQHPCGGGLIEHNFYGNLLTNSGFDFYCNGEKVDNIYLIAVVSVELLINYFSRAFESSIRHKVVDALHSHVCEIEQPKFGRSAYKPPRESDSICTVKYPTRMPSTTKLLEIMNEINYRSDMQGLLDTLLEKCSSMYSDETLSIISDCLSHYSKHKLISLYPITKIDSIALGNSVAENMILANCLKNNFARNDIFRKSHVGRLSRVASSVFDSSIDLQTYPDQSVLIQQYLRQGRI